MPGPITFISAGIGISMFTSWFPSKADTQGQLTVRSCTCICRARSERPCPWHAADRQLCRLYLLRQTGTQVSYLFPAADGEPLSKSKVVRIFVFVLTAADILLTRPDECGREVSRLQGHVVRVSGTQFLASMGLSMPMVQLQGRWNSCAIDRYVPLVPRAVAPASGETGCSGGARFIDRVDPAGRQPSPASD